MGEPRRPSRLGLPVAAVLALATYLLIPDAQLDDAGKTVSGLSQHGRSVAATGVLMATLWVTEAIPIPATSLLPIVLLPLLTGGGISVGSATSPYANELIFLFLGGFLIALAMQRWSLDRRIALHTIRIVGTQPRRLIGGFMLATALLSMWVSNTATVMLMMPIALSVIAVAKRRASDGRDEEVALFAACLLLATAYAGSIGGIATLIGTPPNLLLAAFLRAELGLELSFARWLLIGLPFAAVMLPITWWLLTSRVFAVNLDSVVDSGFVDEQLRAGGRTTREEWLVLLVFATAALCWLTGPWLQAVSLGGMRPLSGLSDASVAIGAALVLFMLPTRDGQTRLLTWEAAEDIPWGVLLLFGGGLSLAGAVRTTGVADFIGRSVAGLGQLPGIVVIATVVTMVVFLTELTSNTATTATLLPVLTAVARGFGLDPIQLAIPATMAASCAFMLPVATPPNAIVFGTGHITMKQMIRAGFWLNIVSIGLLIPIAYVATAVTR